jgi:ankyrin repeat protein
LSTALPPRPHLDWYRNAAKQKLAEWRASRDSLRLADAQLAIARAHGFPSWRALKAAVDTAERTAFFDAIRNDQPDAVSGFLNSRPALVAAKTARGETALHVAAEANASAVVTLLLSHGASARARYGSSSHTALSWALTTGSFDAAEALVRGGIEPDLFCAAGLGAVERVQQFFDDAGSVRLLASRTGSSRFDASGTRLPAPPSDSRDVVSDALYMASRNGQAEVVRFLLTRDVDVNFRAFLDGTPLPWSYYSGSRATIDLLIAAGADETRRDSEYRCTPRAFGVCVTASWGLAGRLDLALRVDPSLLNVLEGRGTPLHEAARAGEIETVRFLIDAGADRTLRDADGCTPLDLAARYQHASTVALLSAT